jgi:hypothetical protein
LSDTIDDAKEGIEQAHHAAAHGDGGARRIAVLIAGLAAMLAMAEMATKSAQNEYMTRHIAASDDWAFYQAKDVRAALRNAEAAILESLPGAGQGAGQGADPALQARVKAAREAEIHFRDDPSAGNGMKQLADKARTEEAERDHALHRYHQFELVVGGLQIAIVLASVSVVTRVQTIAWASGMLGVLAGMFALLVHAGIV